MKRTALLAALGTLLIYANYASRQPYPGFVRLKFEIHDEEGRPAGARLRVTNAAGEYFAPLGHLPKPDMTQKSSNDLILGDGESTPLTLYALVHDGAEIDLRPGKYHIEATRGYEVQSLRQELSISESTPSGQTVALPLHKFIDFESKGWYPGDTHIHFPDPSGVRYEMECEGLRVCSILLLKNGYKDGRPGDGNFWNVEHFTGRLSPVSDSRYFVKVGEEFRHGLLAHLIFQNLKSIVWPVSTGGLRENGAGGYDWPLMLHASDEAHAQGALVTWAHWPYPSLEAPLDIALGRIDSIDLLTTGNPFEHHPILVDVYKMRGPKVYSLAPVDVYYHYLNCGFHLAMSSGSDKMALNPPLGSARTYVRTDAPLTYDSWIEGIRKGHTFATNYPLVEFSVNGVGPGDTVKLQPGKVRLAVKASALSLEPYDVLEIVYNGKVIRSVKPSGNRYAVALDESIELDRGGWIAARAHGRKMLPYGATWWQMPVFAHTSPIYLDMPGRPALAAESARLFLDQLDYLERWADQANFPIEANRRETLDLVRQAREIYQRLTHEEAL